ncbi:MAG: hypothetical protein HYS13_18510 [Planctomycetia bacterium]|nr:hypothetical protein [Planctomycetia bacterium]
MRRFLGWALYVAIACASLFLAATIFDWRWSAVALAILIVVGVTWDALMSAALPWPALYEDGLGSAQPRRIEGWGGYAESADIPAWLADAAKVVRASIDGGDHALLDVSRVVVCRRLRAPIRGRLRRSLGFVLTRTAPQGYGAILFITNHARRNWLVLYEETAHCLRRLVGGKLLRYDDRRDTLVILEGLRRSEVFARLPWYDKWAVERAIGQLRAGTSRTGICLWPVWFRWLYRVLWWWRHFH